MPPHCDTMDGPVVSAAKKALRSEDVTNILPWIPKDREEEVKEAFNKTLKVRKTGGEAKELADLWFYETCVRIHRMGEGASYEGIKPAGQKESPAVKAADKSLENESIEGVIDLLKESVEKGVKQRYQEVNSKKKKAKESVEAGREWVHSYVHFIHYVKGIYDACLGLTEHKE